MDVFRRAGLTDAAAIHLLFFSSEGWQTFRTRFVTWLNWQAHGRMVYLLVERTEQLVGHGQLFLLPRNKAEIANVEVAAAYRDQGLGTAFINNLIHEAKTRSCSQIEISVAHTNPRARALYQRLGFHSERPLSSSHDQSGVIMKMIIG